MGSGLVDERERLGYAPALDGVRAVAVVAVLLFHGGVSWAGGGFLGVDVFFVLSGFLITTLLLEEASGTGRVALRAFWARRARRLLPALLVVIGAVLALSQWIAPDRPFREVRLDAVAGLGYVANWRFIAADADYFARAAGPSPLEHLWSLAVEEQFYLVWPVVAAVLLVRRHRALLGIVAAIGAVASATAMAVLYDGGSGTSRAYFGADTRIHVVLVGAAAAVLLDRLRARSSGVPPVGDRACGAAALVGLAVVLTVIATSTGQDSFLYHGGFLAVAVETAIVLVAVTVAPGCLVARALAVRPLVELGRISYGVYLWHWPVYLYLTNARTGLTGPSLLAARMGATVVLSIVSAALIELPVRRERVLRGPRGVLVLPAAAVVAIVVLFATLVQWQNPQEPTLASELASANPAANLPVPSFEGAEPTPMPPPAPGEPLRVLVVGDSVAITLAQGLVGPARAHGAELHVDAVLGCGVVRGTPYRYFGKTDEQLAECADWPARWQRAVQYVRPHVVLAVVGRWEVMDRAFNGAFAHVGEPSFDTYLLEELALGSHVLRSTGARVAFATAPYYKRGERPDGGIWPEDEPARVDAFNALVRRVASTTGDAVVDLNARTSDGAGGYTDSIDGFRIRYDGVHFTRHGAESLAPWLLPQLVALGRAT